MSDVAMGVAGIIVFVALVAAVIWIAADYHDKHPTDWFFH